MINKQLQNPESQFIMDFGKDIHGNSFRIQQYWQIVLLILVFIFGQSQSSFVGNENIDHALTRRLYLSGKGSNDTIAWHFKLERGRGSGEWRKIQVPSYWALQ